MVAIVHMIIDGPTCKKHFVSPDAYRDALLLLEPFRDAKILVDFSSVSLDADYSRDSAISKIDYEGHELDQHALYAVVREAFKQQIRRGEA